MKSFSQIKEDVGLVVEANVEIENAVQLTEATSPDALTKAYTDFMKLIAAAYDETEKAEELKDLWDAASDVNKFLSKAKTRISRGPAIKRAIGPRGK